MVDSPEAIAERHDFDKTFTAEFDNNQTAATLITPTSGKLLKITGVFISTEGATTIAQKIRLYFGTTGDTVVTVFPSAVANQATAVEIKNLLIRGARNEVLKITSNLGVDKNYFVLVNYKEE